VGDEILFLLAWANEGKEEESQARIDGSASCCEGALVMSFRTRGIYVFAGVVVVVVVCLEVCIK
jgi:hypothetical protein